MSSVKYVQARTVGGKVVSAFDVDFDAWEQLKRDYKVGDLLLPCGCAAVPKTSPRGTQFFAHVAGACETAPETQWHFAAKALMQQTATALGYSVALEQEGKTGSSGWRADVLIEGEGGRRVAIEIQRSYQHLREYDARQKRYQDAEVFAVWLLDEKGHRTLRRATGRHRMKTEFGGRLPKGRPLFPCLPDLPVAYLEFEPEPIVKGVGFFVASPSDWVRAVVEGRFVWDDGKWIIADSVDAKL